MKNLTIVYPFKIEYGFKINIFVVKNDNEKWSRKNISEILPCASHFQINWFTYSIVKDSSADLGVNSKIVQIRPTVKAVSTKISKIFFCIFVNILIFLKENKEVSF